KVKREPRTGRIFAKIAAVVFSWPLEKLAQLRGAGHRGPAAEAFAYVGGGAVVHGSAFREERGLAAAPGPAGQDQVGTEGGAYGRRQLGQVVADQGDLLGRGEVEVEGA